jgi:hypothetical protein
LKNTLLFGLLVGVFCILVLPLSKLFTFQYVLLWIYLFIFYIFFKVVFIQLSFIPINVIINNSVNSNYLGFYFLMILGNINGISQSLISFSRAIGPGSSFIFISKLFLQIYLLGA